MAHDAFISYSTRDKAAADAACAALEAMGIRCWIAPRDVTPGAEWGEAIIEGINQSRVVVLIFSANANESPQIRREVERAVSKGIPILPLRIQDVAPAGSLEYFIGTVHWLDALTPPLEAHLLRLGETVKTLLQINPARPRIVRAPAAAGGPAVGGRRGQIAIALALVASGATAIGVWRYLTAVEPAPPIAGAPSPTPVAVLPTPSAPPPPVATPSAPSASLPTPAPPPPIAKPLIDPALVGTFEHDGVVDDYDERIVFSVAAEGTYRLVTTLTEDGVYAAGGGKFRTTAYKTGRVRTGTYRAVGDAAIEVTSATGSAIFRPAQQTAPLDPRNPAMLGAWRATVTLNGVQWTLTIDNSPDHTYHYEARAEDDGDCAYADQKWRATSRLTGVASVGTYRVADASAVEITGPAGPALWRRR